MDRMDRHESDINPISQIHSKLWTLISEMIVKNGTKADRDETLETRKYVDSYMDAMYQRDIYEGYTYNQDDFFAVGITDEFSINHFINHPDEVPQTYKELLFLNKRKKTIEEYNEPNDYYRKLNGLPPLDSIGGKIVDKHMEFSLEIVKDSEDFETYGNPHIITVSSARKIMRTVLFNVGNHIAILEASIQFSQSSKTRSFLIVEDHIDIRDMDYVIYYRDAISISTMLHLDIGMLSPGNYIYINEKNVMDTSNIFDQSYLVVKDDDAAYDTNTMVKLTEARMSVPSCEEGNHIVFAEYLYPTMEHETVYGLSRKVPIHNIASYYGERFLVILESLGYLKELRDSHKEKKYTYLEHLGVKKIGIIRARSARAYDLLYLPDIGNDIIRQQFAISYNGARDYFMSTVYNFHYNEIYDYYENFIGLAICQMALQQTIVRAEYTALNRDFYDNSMVKMLYDSYEIPYSSRLSQHTQNRILKNLNMLIQNKASNKVIYDIATLLGYHDIQVYKYYLMKERKMDSDGNPIYFDSSTVGFIKDEEGKLVQGDVVINDLRKMYDVYFQKVELKETDYQKAFADTANRVDYEEITFPDPLWWDDGNTFDAVYGDPTKFTAETEPEVYHKHYNYVESKYLGVTIAYKLTEVVYENILLLRMILEKKVSVGDIILTFPNITGTLEVSLFDTIVFLCAMLCKQSHLSGEILTKVSTILGIIGYMTVDADGYIPCDTLAFNFEAAQNAETFKDLMEYPGKYLSKDEEKMFYDYLSVLTLPTADQKTKIEVFNKMYSNIKSLGYFITKKMSHAETTTEYRAWRDLYNALFLEKEIHDVFRIGETERVATTYMDYLRTMNPRLYNVIMECEDYLLFSYIDHVIYRMEQLIPDLDTMQTINDSNSSAHEYLIKLIKFFKSYTTDMVSLDTQYIFDLKPDNLLKLTEMYHIDQVDGYSDIFRMIYSDAMHVYYEAKQADSVAFRDIFVSDNTISAFDFLPINRMFKSRCVDPYCEYRCWEDKNACKKKENCRFYGYDTKAFREYGKTYISTVLTVRELAGVDISTKVLLEQAIRSHLLHVGRIFCLVDSFRFSTDFSQKRRELDKEILILKDTLAKLNAQILSDGYLVKINSTGVDRISKEAIELTSMDSPGWTKVCRNDDYPCLKDGMCPGILKESVYFLDTLYKNNKIFIQEMVDTYITYELYSFITWGEFIDMNLITGHDEVSRMPTYDDFYMNIMNGVRGILNLMDSSYHEQEIETSDKLHFHDQLFFIEDNQ